ncbi:MAG: DUF5711 family protein [Oscillospiraceae bacterium]|jgi:hypothetical protein|nr:DUF5711 family protein [Oscillospiraceae bacterium]
MGKSNDITAYRRKKKREGFLLRLLPAGIVAVGIALIIINAETVFAPLEGIAKNFFERKPSGEAGFPVNLPGSAGYYFNGYDGGFMLLTDTYVYMYAENGARNNALQHGYANPRACVGDKRILIYDRNGRQFSLYGKNGRVYENGGDDRIVYAELGESNCAAVVFRGTVYASVLEVYDGKGRWKYRRRFVHEHVMRVAFTGGDKELIVASIGFDSGDNTACVRKFDTSSENEDGIWKTVLPPNELPFAIYCGAENIFVLCDTAIFTLDAKSGAIKSDYVYDGTLTDYSFTDKNAALLVSDYSAGAKRLIVLDGNGGFLSLKDVGNNSAQVEIYDRAGSEMIYVLESDRIFEYDKALNLMSEYNFGDEYSKFIKAKENFYLLGYDTVEMRALSENE